MFHPANTWPATKASNGTKFFAQAMRAFLDKNSFEGFRAYSLDTIGRLREADTLIEDILAKRVREPALQPVLDELIWSITNDDAASTIAPSECQILVDLCKDRNAPKKVLLHACRMLVGTLRGTYREQLVTRVTRAINDDRANRDISICRFFGEPPTE